MSEKDEITKGTKIQTWITYGIIALVLLVGVAAAFSGSSSSGSNTSSPASSEQMF